MKKFFNVLCMSSALLSCCSYGMRINPERVALFDADKIFPQEAISSRFENLSKDGIQQEINTNPGILNELSLDDTYKVLTSNVQLPGTWSVENVLAHVLNDVLTPEEVRSILSNYSSCDAWAFFSLAMIYKQFLILPPKENQNLGPNDGDERIIRVHILNTYLRFADKISQKDFRQRMQIFFRSTFLRYGNAKAEKLREYYEGSFSQELSKLPQAETEEIKNLRTQISKVLQTGIDAINSDSDISCKKQKIFALLSHLGIIEKTDLVKEQEITEKINTLTFWLNDLKDNFSTIDGLLSRDCVERCIGDIRNTLDLNQTETLTKNPIDDYFSQYFELPSMHLTTTHISGMMLMGAQIRENIYWAYNYKPEGVYESVGKVQSGPYSGTGTVIQTVDMPESMKGRVVLTAAHTYLNDQSIAGRNFFNELDVSKSKTLLQAYSQETPFTYKTLAGKETVTEHPTDRPNKDNPKNIRENVTYKVKFKDKDVSKIYLLMDNDGFETDDFAIFILKEPARKNDGSALVVPILSQYKELSNNTELEEKRNLFTIGCGGWNHLDRIEFPKQKATIPFTMCEVCGHLSGGDSGSAIFYHNGQNISVVGEATPVNHFINNDRYQWINAVVQDAAQNP